MRIGEVRGLRKEHVFKNYIKVCGQYTHRHGYKDKTKTKRDRNIPITAEIKQELDSLLEVNGDGYVFSEDGGATPLTPERIYRAYDKALDAIGIDHRTRIERGLTFHAWRHFFNTALRMDNVTDAKVQSVTGHLTQKETDHYTHFDTTQFAEIREVQTKLMGGKAGGTKQRVEKKTAKGKGAVKQAGRKKPATKQAVRAGTRKAASKAAGHTTA
jgi:integrase